MQLTIELTLNEDSELIHMANGTDAGRVVVKRLYLWLPRLIPKDSMYSQFVSDFLKPTTWTYMRDLYNQSANTRAVQNMFQISPAIDNVKHVFIYLQRTDAPNDVEVERSPYLFDTFKLNAANANSSLSSCRLEYGITFFTQSWNMIVTLKYGYLMISCHMHFVRTITIQEHSLMYPISLVCMDYCISICHIRKR